MRPEQVTEVMHDPLAQELLHSAIPARMAYNGTDGNPRVIPVGFLWKNERIVVCTASNAYKVGQWAGGRDPTHPTGVAGLEHQILAVRKAVPAPRRSYPLAGIEHIISHQGGIVVVVVAKVPGIKHVYWRPRIPWGHRVPEVVARASAEVWEVGVLS